MKPYLVALAAGVLVGVIYGLLKVKSPAPPTIALIGLLGILLGEQIVPLAQSLWAERHQAAALRSACTQRVFGRLPGDTAADTAANCPKTAA